MWGTQEQKTVYWGFCTQTVSNDVYFPPISAPTAKRMGSARERVKHVPLMSIPTRPSVPYPSLAICPFVPQPLFPRLPLAGYIDHACDGVTKWRMGTRLPVDRANGYRDAESHAGNFMVKVVFWGSVYLRVCVKRP